MKKSRLIFALVPKYYWIALIVGLLFRLLGGDYWVLSNIIITFLVLLLFVKVGILIHEMGHLFLAWIVGGKPRRLVLGTGHEVTRFDFRNIKVVINSPLRGGFAFATFEDRSFLGLRSLLYVSGGFLFNLLSACVVFYFHGFYFDSLSGEYGIDFGTAFIFSNAVLAILTLIPHRLNYMGIRIANDGLNMLKLPFRKGEFITEQAHANDLLDAYDFFELKEYDKAIGIYEGYLKTNPIQVLVYINLSVMYMKKGDFLKSLELLTAIEGSLEEKQNRGYRALFNNNMAWICLLQSHMDRADEYSRKALDLAPKEKNIQGTRGSVLVEMGEIDLGVNLLSSLVDFRFANSQTLTAGMFLTLAFHLKNQEKEKQKHLDFIERNAHLLDVDEVKIWNGIKQKILPVIK
ncbi:MAG: hypothetical protein ABFS10_05800 [Bacteroidota bacterium]